MNEIWKDIKDYEGLYQVSNFGRVKSVGRWVTSTSKLGKQYKKYRRGIILRHGYKSEYSFVVLSKNGEKIQPLVHILVAQHFIPNPENKPIVHHIDHNKNNNHVDNLMWVTVKEHGDLHPEWVWQKKSMTVIQYTLDGQFVAEYPSASEAGRQNGIGNSCISRCCKGKIGYKSAGGYIWKYKDINVKPNGIM